MNRFRLLFVNSSINCFFAFSETYNDVKFKLFSFLLRSESTIYETTEEVFPVVGFVKSFNVLMKSKSRNESFKFMVYAVNVNPRT